MIRRRFLLFLVSFAALLGLFPLAAGTYGQEPTVRLLVKVRAPLARDVESALPLASMALVPGQSGNPNVETFLSRHGARKIAPLYPDIVRIKKVNGLSDFEIASAVRQAFAKRAVRLHAAFQPPEISRTYVLEIDRALSGNLNAVLSDLKADPNVEYAEKDHLYSGNLTPNDPYFSSFGSWGQNYDDLWGIKKIGAPAAWDTSTGTGVIVAVVDTGIDYNHPDIAGNVWINSKEIAGNGIDDDNNGYVDDVRGWNFVGASFQSPQQSNDPIDHNGHGTHVAGTIAAVGNNGIGVIGVAWNAHVMAVKGLDDSGTGTDSTLGPAILYAANNGADIVSASWGGPEFSQTIADAITYAYDLGAVIVVAAGNNSEDARDFYPAALPNVITVAASDSNDNLASFSNFGSKIDVAAPGVDILSLQAAGSTLGPVVSPGYMRLSGTSMATPHVSGLAALILSQHPAYSNEDVRQVLRVSATDLGDPGYDLSYGYGRINASAALGVNGVLEAKITAPPDGTVTSGQLTISGVARGTAFSHYVLEYGAGALPTAWTTITTSSTPTAGTLGVFDTTSLSDGVYAVRLTAFNASNQAFVDRIQVVAHPIFILSPTPPPAPTSATSFKNGALIPITGNAVGGNFTNFQVDWAPGLDASSGWQNTGVSLIGGGLSPISSGLLATWDTSGISGAGYYTIRLTVNAASTSRQVLTMVYFQPDLLSTNWPQFLSQGTYFNSGVVPALNADGSLRLMAEGATNGPGNGQVWTLTPNGSVQQTGLPSYGSYQQPAVGDLDGNPGDETAVADYAGVEVVRADGSTYTLSSNPAFYYSSSQVEIEDLNGDSHNETIALATDFDTQLAYLSAWHADGSLLNNNFPIQLLDQNPVYSWYNRARFIVGDVDNDGKKELVVQEGLSPTTFTLKLFANDGSPRTWAVPVLNGIPIAMVAADLDQNGMLETILVYYAASGTQAILDVRQPDGTERAGWPLTLPNPNQYSQSFLAVADLNQDGHDEIVYSHETFLYVFKDDGTIFSGTWPLTTSGSTGYGSVTVGDVDGDGFPEIVTTLNTVESTADPYFIYGGRYYNEQLLAIRRDGTISKSWQLTGSNGYSLYVYPAPAIGDFNQDGITDIAVSYLVTGTGGLEIPGIVTILTTGAPFNPAKNDWPLVRQNPRNTGVLPETIGTSPSATSLTGFPTALFFGDLATFTSVVTPLPNTSGAAQPTGRVDFLEGSANLGICVLVAGRCNFGTVSLNGGTHTIVAKYPGDHTYAASTSQSFSVTVLRQGSVTTLSSSVNPSVVGETTNLTALVRPVSAGVPTGTVTFFDGAVQIGTAQLDVSQQATLGVSNLTQGTHSLTATYNGDTNFLAGATSAATSQVVNAADFSLSVSSAPPVNAGSPAVFTITVTPNPSPYNFAVSTFGCASLPLGTECQFNPPSVTPGSGTATTTLTITTTSRTLAAVAPSRDSKWAMLALWLGTGAMCFIGIVTLPVKRAWKRKMWFAILLLSCIFGASCGGGGSSGPGPNPNGTPAGTYNVMVTAAGSGSTTHNVIATLQVN